jgi:hypothetical protein
VIGDVVPLGIGLTESPAADVVGVVVEVPEEDAAQPDDDLKNQNPSKKEKPSKNREEEKASQKQTKKTKRSNTIK